MTEPDKTPESLRAQMRETTRRALTFWAARWSIGLVGAVAIVLWTGDHHWLPLAAGLIALISLAVIGLNWSAMKKRIAAAEQKEGHAP